MLPNMYIHSHIHISIYIYIHTQYQMCADEITSPIQTRPSTSGRAPEVEEKIRIGSYSPHGIVISHIEIPKLHPVSFPWDYSIPCWLRLFFRKMHRVCDLKLLFLLFFFFFFLFLFYLWVAYEMPPGLAASASVSAWSAKVCGSGATHGKQQLSQVKIAIWHLKMMGKLLKNHGKAVKSNGSSSFLDRDKMR